MNQEMMEKKFRKMEGYKTVQFKIENDKIWLDASDASLELICFYNKHEENAVREAVIKTRKKIIRKIIDGIRKWSEMAWKHNWMRKWTLRKQEGWVDETEVEASIQGYIGVDKLIKK